MLSFSKIKKTPIPPSLPNAVRNVNKKNLKILEGRKSLFRKKGMKPVPFLNTTIEAIYETLIDILQGKDKTAVENTEFLSERISPEIVTNKEIDRVYKILFQEIDFVGTTSPLYSLKEPLSSYTLDTTIEYSLLSEEYPDEEGYAAEILINNAEAYKGYTDLTNCQIIGAFTGFFFSSHQPLPVPYPPTYHALPGSKETLENLLLSTSVFRGTTEREVKRVLKNIKKFVEKRMKETAKVLKTDNEETIIRYLITEDESLMEGIMYEISPMSEFSLILPQEIFAEMIPLKPSKEQFYETAKKHLEKVIEPETIDRFLYALIFEENQIYSELKKLKLLILPELYPSNPAVVDLSKSDRNLIDKINSTLEKHHKIVEEIEEETSKVKVEDLIKTIKKILKELKNDCSKKSKKHNR